jgi:hypothetical protein
MINALVFCTTPFYSFFVMVALLRSALMSGAVRLLSVATFNFLAPEIEKFHLVRNGNIKYAPKQRFCDESRATTMMPTMVMTHFFFLCFCCLFFQSWSLLYYLLLCYPHYHTEHSRIVESIG